MDIENTLVMQGGAIKALGESEAAGRPVGKLGGVLCRFSSADDPDQTRERDFFDAKTNFKLADGMTTPVYYHHGLHAGVGVKEIGQGVLRTGRDGIDIACELWLDDADGARYFRQAKAGKLAWSSGTAAHLVKRTPVAATSGGISHHIDFWPLGLDASLTPNAAEPRNVAVALKSLMDEEAGGETATSLWSYTDGDSGCHSLQILEAGQLEGSRLVDHTVRLRDAVAEYSERVGDIALNRAMKAGRVFSADRHATLCALLAQIREAADTLGDMLTAHAPDAVGSGGEAVAGKACLDAHDVEIDALESRFLQQQMWLQSLEMDEVWVSCPWLTA